MIDGGLRGTFHTNLRVGIHWQAIETGGTGQGIPDSNFCGESVGEAWVEFKKTDAWSVAIDTEQVGWHKARLLRGGRVFLAVRRHHDGGPRKGPPVDELWICSGWHSGVVKREGLRTPEVDWLGVWSGGKSRWDWDEVREVLATPLESLRPPYGAGAGY